MFVKNRKQNHLVNNSYETAYLYLRYYHFNHFYKCAGNLSYDKGYWKCLPLSQKTMQLPV